MRYSLLSSDFYITCCYLCGYSSFPSSEDFGKGFANQEVSTNIDFLGERAMFYDVKILDPQGKIKKTISGQELGKRHWNAFFTAEANKTLNSSGQQRVPTWVKKRLDMEYVQFSDRSVSA